MPIITFDTYEIGDNDQFIRTVRFLEGCLLRFTMFDGTVIDGIVKGDENEFWNDLTVELWDGDNWSKEPTLQTVNLDEVAEVYYY